MCEYIGGFPTYRDPTCADANAPQLYASNVSATVDGPSVYRPIALTDLRLRKPFDLDFVEIAQHVDGARGHAAATLILPRVIGIATTPAFVPSSSKSHATPLRSF